MIEPISDDDLAAMRRDAQEAATIWAMEVRRLIARLDIAESKNALAESVLEACAPAMQSAAETITELRARIRDTETIREQIRRRN